MVLIARCKHIMNLQLQSVLQGVSHIHDHCPLLKFPASCSYSRRLTWTSYGLQRIIKVLFPKDLGAVSGVCYCWSMSNQLIISTDWNCFWFRSRFAIAAHSKITSVVIICVLNLNSNWNCRFSSISRRSRFCKQFINMWSCPYLEPLWSVQWM